MEETWISKTQKEEEIKFINRIMNSILDDIKRRLRDNPYVHHIDYFKGDAINLREFPSKIPQRYPIYSTLDEHFDLFHEALKEEGIELTKKEIYETRTKGFFKKTEYKFLKIAFFRLEW